MIDKTNLLVELKGELLDQNRVSPFGIPTAITWNQAIEKAIEIVEKMDEKIRCK